MVSLCFFRVGSADAPAPYGGDPPAEAATDCHQVAKQVDLNTESSQVRYELPFSVERPAGFYYLQVRAILFRAQAGKVFAQVEPFFYSRRPLEITEPAAGFVTLPMSWPRDAVEDLEFYGVLEPQGDKQAEPGAAPDPAT
jgi:hypothetical protein